MEPRWIPRGLMDLWDVYEGRCGHRVGEGALRALAEALVMGQEYLQRVLAPYPLEVKVGLRKAAWVVILELRPAGGSSCAYGAEPPSALHALRAEGEK